MSDIITFYSYKGGVGRTMALANVSVMLAKWGHRVLVVDWDLEAPGLEHFYQDYFDTEVVRKRPGVVDLLQLNDTVSWKDGLIEVKISGYGTISMLSSGRRDEDYFKKVRDFNVDVFYENGGGDVVERLREEWLAEYDYVLIDSRTGITEIGGICTIQLPNAVVMLFTATRQGFEGTLDIINRAAIAQQKLPYDRQKLIFLPIPSKFDSAPEFKLSQAWLANFAEKLEPTYRNWLPGEVSRKDFLELTKIPYLPYFSFGEKLPVIEQGVKDPAGLGYAYETLAALVANHLSSVEVLSNNRDLFISQVDEHYSETSETSKNGTDLDGRIKKLRQRLQINDEMLNERKSQKAIASRVLGTVEPLIRAISNGMRQFSDLFKEFRENIEIKYFDSSEQLVKRNVIEVQNNLTRAIHSYFRVDGVFYHVYVNGLIKLSGYNFNTVLSIYISFYDVLYEISAPDINLVVEKNYNEDINPSDITKIVELSIAYVLDKVENILK